MLRKKEETIFLALAKQRGKIMHMKPILPSLREKKRYLVFEVISRKKHGSYAVSQAVSQKALEFLGELNAANAGVQVLGEEWSLEKQKGTLKVNRKYVNHLKAALCLVSRVGKSKAIIRSAGVSGTISKAHKKFMAG